MRQFQCVPTTYVTEIKETYFEIYTKQVSCPIVFLFETSQTANIYQYYYYKFEWQLYNQI